MVNSISSFLERQKKAVIYLNDQFTVIKISPQAKRLINQAKTIEIQDQKITLKQLEANRRLYKDLKTTLKSNNSRVTFLSQPNQKTPFRVELHSIKGSDETQGDETAVLLVLLGGAEASGSLMSHHFKQQYSLTNAEIRLVESLHLGHTLAEFAEKRKIKVSTVRWTLRNVFTKTRASSQSELRSLTRLFSGLPPHS